MIIHIQKRLMLLPRVAIKLQQNGVQSEDKLIENGPQALTRSNISLINKE
tara:strand:+ start:33 stop:182 length:150 start_codon:yes stop_codon:yes gene_type:complete